MIPAINTAVGGLHNSLRGFATSARQIAEATVPSQESVRGVREVEGERDVAVQLGQRETAEPVRSREESERPSDRDLARAVVELNRNDHAARASIAVIKSADRMLGTLLDVVG